MDESGDQAEKDRVAWRYLWLANIPFGLGILLQAAQNPDNSMLAGYGLLGIIVAGVLCAGYAVLRFFAKYAAD